MDEGEEIVNLVKNKAKDYIKNKVMSLLTNPIFYAVIGVLLVILVVAGAFITVDASTINNSDGMSDISGGNTGISGGTTSESGGSNIGSWQQFLSFVLQNEGGTRVNELGEVDSNGAYYIVEDDYAGNPSIGHGLCLLSYADSEEGKYLHVTEFAEYNIDTKELVSKYYEAVNNGYNSKNSSHTKYFPKVSAQICDAIWEDNLKEKYKEIEGKYPYLTEYQKYALIDALYRRGNTDGFESKYNLYWKKEYNEIYYGKDISGEEYDSVNTLFNFFWNGGHTLPGVNTRKKNQWLLFKYGYFAGKNEYCVSELGGSNNVTITDVSGQAHYNKIITVGSKSYKVWNQYSYTPGTNTYQAGCGPSCAAVVMSAHGFEYDVQDVVDEMGTQPHVSTLAGYLTKKGIDTISYTEYTANESNKSNAVSSIRNNLSAGRPVIILVRTGPDKKFTRSAHYMTLVGITSNDEAIIADSVYGQVRYMDLKTLVDSYVYSSSSNGYQYALIQKD